MAILCEPSLPTRQRFCGYVETSGRGTYQKTWHTRQEVNTGCAEQADESAPPLSLCIYLMFAIGRLAIRLSPVTPRNQLCVGTAGCVKWQRSGTLCRDKMLQKCSCCSLEDQTTAARCIADLSNGKYRIELDLYSLFLKRWRWGENKKKNNHKQTEKQYGVTQTKSHWVCVSKRGKVKSRTKYWQNLLKTVLCSFLLFHRCQNHKGFPYIARENLYLNLKDFFFLYFKNLKFLVKQLYLFLQIISTSFKCLVMFQGNYREKRKSVTKKY